MRFELTEPMKVHTLSRRAHSTTLPPIHFSNGSVRLTLFVRTTQSKDSGVLKKVGPLFVHQNQPRQSFSFSKALARWLIWFLVSGGRSAKVEQ